VKPYRQGRIRFLVLFLLAMVMFGNQYAFNNPQALQESIMDELDIKETQYDWLYTIFALPNIFATFIIGFLIDFLGVRIGIIALSLGVVIFQAVVATGGAVKSYTCMLIGRMLFGIASESLVTAQASFVSFWFVGK
jgi:MFS family permease